MRTKINLTKNQKTKDSLINRIQYWLLFIFISSLYIAGDNKDYTIFYYIPITLFSLIELGYMLSTKKINITKHILAILGFSLFCLISCLWADNKTIAISRTTTIFFLTSTLIFIYNYCIRTKTTIKNILNILLFSGLLFSLYIVIYYGIENILGIFTNYSRLGEEINNVNMIGIELAITALIAIYFGINEDKKYFLLSVIPIILSLGTASKKAIIILLLGTILLIILNNKDKLSIKTFFKKLLLPILIFILTLTTVQLELFPTLTKRLNYYSNSFFSDNYSDGSTMERNTFIEYGFRSFLDHPMSGIGIGNSGTITIEASGRDTYLHNNYIELLATTGLFGTFLYYYIIISILLFAIKNRKKKDAPIIITIMILSLFMDWGMVSYYEKLTYMFVLIGTLFYSNTLQERKKIND